MTKSALPRIAVTMGDPAGIGPETCLRLLNNPELAQVGVPTAGLAAASTAGNAAAVPALVAAANPAYAQAAQHATVLVSTSVVVTAIVVPFVTAWWAARVARRSG